MTLGDQRFAEHLTKNGYHPRSSKHGEAMSLIVLEDLVATCPHFRELASRQRLVYKIDMKLAKGTPDAWTMDLVVGPPASIARKPKHRIAGITEGVPGEIWFAMDAKSIMTEHGKARRNRFRDITALERRVHGMNPNAIVGGCIALNAAESFRSQLREASDVTIHQNVLHLVEGTVALFEGIGLTPVLGASKGLEGLAVVVVDHTNEPGRRTRLLREPPAPSSRSRVFYPNFLRDICKAFGERFGRIE